jgi:hypothetical protein
MNDNWNNDNNDDRGWARMNQLIIDLNECEALSWVPSKHDPDLYSVRFHMKTGRYHQRTLANNQLQTFRDAFKSKADDMFADTTEDYED